MKAIKCTPGDLDYVKDQFDNFSHFTVRHGKAKYHLLYLADNSCGIYYAVRVVNGGLEGKRALEPTDEIICWGNKKKLTKQVNKHHGHDKKESTDIK